MRKQHGAKNADHDHQQRSQRALGEAAHLPPPVISSHGHTAKTTANPTISIMAITTARGMRHHSGLQAMGFGMSSSHSDRCNCGHDCD